jgi:hypothetical protein
MGDDDRPVVIGGSGGSGTEVVATVCRRAGLYMGVRLNRHLDALELRDFYTRWIGRFLVADERPLEPDERRAMEADFRAGIARHLEGRPDPGSRWGFKNPTSMYVLPFLDGIYPGLRFVHVLRDGRDMAYSRNQNQLRKHGREILRETDDPTEGPEASATIWSRANLAVAGYGESVLRDRYHRIRFEDLCDRPVEVIAGLLDFVGSDGTRAGEFADVVRPPTTIGRWRGQRAKSLRAVLRHARPGLEYFGYLGDA